MTVVYIDSIFLLNALMDYLLLLMTARAAGTVLRRGRYALSALLGGLYAAAVFFPGCAWLSAAPVKLSVGILLALIAFGGEEALFRLILLFYGLSCAMAGTILGLSLLAGHAIPAVNGILYTDIDGKLLAIAASGAYLISRFVLGTLAEKGLRGQRLPVLLELNGKRCAFTALWDTGNTLRDHQGKPVLVADPAAVSALLPAGAATLLRQGRPPDELALQLHDLTPELQPYLLSYRSLGRSGGILLSLRVTRALINGAEHKDLRVAVSPQPLGNGYQALWGGDLKKEKAHGYFSVDENAAPAFRASHKKGSALYRRQRYAASAADEGTRSGAFGTSRS